MDQFISISPKIREFAKQAEADLRDRFAEFDRVAQINTEKVMAAFQENRVSDGCFAGTTGYGYDDKGREVLDQIYADVFHTEAALVRIGFVNGTHAITAALFSALKPGDILLSAAGAPYDTLQSVIGITGDYPGSLKFYGIGYDQCELTSDGKPDYDAIALKAADPRVKAVTIQRSRGYSTRDAFTVQEIGRVAELVHRVNPDASVIVDNCYGEFVDTIEPTDVGADLMAGSLIKNPGGGLAPTGGYVVGKKHLVEAAAMRLTTPGIGGECGCTMGNSRLLFQGLFMAPHIVAQALKTSAFCARMMELMGFQSSPGAFDSRSDIIQVVTFNAPDPMKKFCRGIQMGAPVDSFVTPEPWAMPGYEDPVIMAAGAFVQGSSIELSADGPMREPYCAYLQGGLTYESGRLGVMLAAEHISNI
ncbi:MAG: hypothetical protein E7456_03895 [Ruminococcaceae bacterium]|nr:hypothetical protein [Oscillospiraceae bacterium]